MKVLFFGDIYGRVGRKAFLKELPKLRDTYAPDCIIVNVDNITSGRGAVLQHIKLLIDNGVSVCTGGDHIFDNFESIQDYISSPEAFLLRPENFYSTLPGVGHKLFEFNGKKVVVIHLLGQTFINHKTDNPFLVADKILEMYQKESLDGIIVDFHKEATSEVQALGLYLDGRVSFVGGTHTHVQTNDDYILDNGTGYITDVGMSGPLKSVIGADFGSVKKRFLTGVQRGKISQSLDPHYVVSGVFLDINNMKCSAIEKICIHGKIT